ncbi:MAG: dTMP kinase, partial [Planctomycetota bacterium]
MAKRGKFIVIEGINGSGKTTQAKRLVDKLRKDDISARHSKEPTSWTHAGLWLTDIFAGRAQAPDDMTIAGLFIADRMQHILDQHHGIKKLLDDGINL